MTVVNVHEAKTRLSQLLSAAEAGEDVVIARQGTPVARLVPIGAAMSPEPGIWRTQPGWSAFSFDPGVLAPLQTDEDLAGASIADHADWHDIHLTTTPALSPPPERTGAFPARKPPARR